MTRSSLFPRLVEPGDLAVLSSIRSEETNQAQKDALYLGHFEAGLSGDAAVARSDSRDDTNGTRPTKKSQNGR